MKLKTYSNPFSSDGSYTAEEIQRGVHWLNTDVICPHCEKEQSVPMTGYLGGPCIQCGKRTDGNNN